MGAPFPDALGTAFTFSFIACLVAASASWLRGGKYHYRDEGSETVAMDDSGSGWGSGEIARLGGAARPAEEVVRR